MKIGIKKLLKIPIFFSAKFVATVAFLAFFLNLSLSLNLFADSKNMQELQKVLEKKKQEFDPFADKKFPIDLESLGLDDVDQQKKPSQKASKDSFLPDSKSSSPEILRKETSKNSPASESIELIKKNLPNPPGNPAQNQVNQKEDLKRVEILEIEKNSKNSANSSDSTQKSESQTIKNSEKANQKNSEKSEESNSESSPFCSIGEEELQPLKQKIKKSARGNQVKRSKNPRKISKKLPKKTPEIMPEKAVKDEFAREELLPKPRNPDSKITENELLIAEKTAKLKELERLYSSRYAIQEFGNDLAKEDMVAQRKVVPRRKDLNSFIVEELPPLPILDRYRTVDNFHIPMVLTPKEKIDVMFSAISMGSITFFNEAFKYVQNPNIYNDQGDTILTYSILMRRYPMIAAALAKGADPNLPNKLGHKPVEIAIEMVDFDALELLANNNADLNYVDAFGRTHLMHAARVGFLPAVDLLVRRQVDINAMDEDGFTALSIAYRHQKELVVQYLLKNGAKPWEERKFKTKSESLIKELESRWKR